jgi:serine/threonine protein kinase
MNEANTLQELVPDAKLGHYTIIEQIAEGGMGHVYKAFEPSLQREVAIKVLRHEFSDNPEKIELFENEAQNIASLRHTNIVPVYFVGQQGSLHYFVMPLINGPTLDDWIDAGQKIGQQEGLNILNQAADALNWAYRSQIAHLDIKPSNFLVDETGVILLSDFGLARILSRVMDVNEEEVFGTPAYMSPEQILQEDIDHRSDIYSLGATMYHLMTGHFLFDGDTIDEIVKRHILDDFPATEAASYGLPPGWINLFDRMTQKAKEDRFQDYDELKGALGNISRLKPVTRKKKVGPAPEVCLAAQRIALPADQLYGLASLHPPSWQKSELDEAPHRSRDEVIDGIRRPLRPLTLNRIARRLKQLSQPPLLEMAALSEAVAEVPEAEDLIIRLANTPLGDSEGEVLAPRKAMRSIGMGTSSDLIIMAALLRDDFKQPADFDWRALVDHSLATGLIARALIDVASGRLVPGTGWREPEGGLKKMFKHSSFEKAHRRAFLAGFLHDIGKVVLGEVAPYPYFLILKTAIDQSKPLLQTERANLGTDHQEAGALWLRLCEIDSAYHTVAGKHHGEEKLGLVGSAVALANQMAKRYGLGYSGNPVVEHPNFWETAAWAEIRDAGKLHEGFGQIMDNHFLPIVADLPLFYG